jgi:hypothetical protein
MSDPNAMPDPIDKAYVEAEAVLSDEAARSARRAQVLAAVARRGAADAAASARRPRAWRRGGWLVAACVSGLALVIATQLYRPSAYLSPTRRSAAPAAATKGTATPLAPPASLAAQVPARPTKAPLRAAKSNAETPPVVVASSPALRSSAPTAAEPTPWPSSKAEAAAPPPPQADDASERAAPVQPANQPPPPSADASNAENVTEMVVTAEKRESPRRSVPAAVSAFTGRIRQVFDPGARLRSAAAAGRTTDVERLLEHGAPVDSPDADGETALMKSIEADRPAAAALLLRHGASLDQTNHAGESARDMARDKGDAELNQAIGLSP